MRKLHEQGKEKRDDKENVDFSTPLEFQVTEDDKVVVYQETITKTSSSIFAK